MSEENKAGENDHDNDLIEHQKVRKQPSIAITEIVKCNDDDPDAIPEGEEQNDPENFDQVLEMHATNAAVND